MTTPTFQSTLAPFLDGLVKMRQALGYGDHTFRAHLAHFDRFCSARAWDHPWLSRQLVEAWASSDGPITAGSRAHRIHAMRILGRFIAHTHPETYIPGPTWGMRQQSGFRPHIYSPAELHALLAEAARLTPVGSLRPKTYLTLFGLLASTGLRIAEALALTLADVDLERGLLQIRESKFHKSRALPLHPSAIGPLREYRQARERAGNATMPEAAFFVNERKRALGYPFTCTTFLELARRAGIRPAAPAKGLRIHDLRHAFATTRLLTWYRDGADVQARLPLLTTYMGHVSIISTQIYLETTAELLDLAATRFTSPRLPDILPLSSGASQ
jgi:site-specific recombinase XerD